MHAGIDKDIVFLVFHSILFFSCFWFFYTSCFVGLKAQENSPEKKSPFVLAVGPSSRRLMENSSNPVGAEVRRLHVIYFLSRNGRIEHPHLIRVHHVSRKGVHLRDVKRWLAELRGKDMPESFAWSYKRRYKSGYVWQDLLDEDLITPISDNEYVLKGSEISTTPSSSEEDSNIEKKYSIQKEEDSSDHSSSFQESQDQENQRQEPRKMSSSSPEIFGSEKSSTLTDDSLKLDDHDQDQEKQSSCDHEESDMPSLSKNLSKKKKNKMGCNTDVAASEEKSCSPTSEASASSTSHPAFSKSRNYSNGASHLFRNLITCRATDTNDSAMVVINRSKKASGSTDVSYVSNHHGNSPVVSKELLLKGDKLGGSQRVFRTSGRKSFDGGKASPKNKSDQFGSQKANPAYKPIYGPPCSQCGKPFKPERLHAHMKSCKGMKAWTK